MNGHVAVRSRSIRLCPVMSAAFAVTYLEPPNTTLALVRNVIGYPALRSYRLATGRGVNIRRMLVQRL
jgi:hypothetical protein